MDALTRNMPSVGDEAQAQPVDLHPLCCAAATPAPASWETRLSHLLHAEHHFARKGSYIGVAYTMTAVAIGLNLLTPLYSIYRVKFAFSALTLTLIFATYIVTIIPAMLIFGPLADAFGRGARKIALALRDVRLAVWNVPEQLACFQNVNTPEDWAPYER